MRGRACRPPIVAAAAAGHAAMVKLLLERGADPELRDQNGETAADVAKKAAFVDVLGELARVRQMSARVWLFAWCHEGSVCCCVLGELDWFASKGGDDPENPAQSNSMIVSTFGADQFRRW